MLPGKHLNVSYAVMLACGLIVTSYVAVRAQTSRGSVETLQFGEQRESLKNVRRNVPTVDHEQRNVVWATADEEQIELDVFWPDDPGPHPMIVWIHGGGFPAGGKELGEYACRTFAANSYVAVNTNYRLAPEHKFPAAVNDCLGAVVWAKKHAAEFNGDLHRVAVAGESAGASLAAMVAWVGNDKRFHPTGAGPGDPSPCVSALISAYGLFDFATLAERRSSPALEAYLASTEDIGAASPVSYLTSDSVPTLLVVGDADEIYHQSVSLQERLQELEVPHDMLVADGAEHAFIIGEWDQPNSQLARKAMLAFLNEHLKSPVPLLTTAWSGTWLPDGNPELCGELQCRARHMGDGKWEATFRGYCNRQFLYEVKMLGEERDGYVQFDGQANLGEEEGIYTWTGSIANSIFNGIWQSRNNPGKKGNFVMRPKAASIVPQQ